MTSYQVRFWDIKKIGDTANGRYRVRWAVDGREHCKSFACQAAGRRVPDHPQGRRPRRDAVRPGHRASRPAQDRPRRRRHLV